MRLEIDDSAGAQATATQVATASGNIAALYLLPEGVVAALEAGQGALFVTTIAPEPSPNTPAMCRRRRGLYG